MSWQIDISQYAKEQADAAADWYAQHNPEIADRWFNGLITAIETIAINPLLYQVARESEVVEQELRQMLYGVGRRTTHRVLFELRAKTIYVHYIQHVAQQDILPG